MTLSATLLALVGLVYYVFDGYFRLLSLASLAFGREPDADFSDAELPEITVLITVFNEADEIVERIDDVLATSYPADRLRVVIASDGSMDDTEQLVTDHPDPRVSLFKPAGERAGKSDTQNQAVAEIHSEILVFSDAGTRFAASFLREIVRPFADPAVGCATGVLSFRREGSPGLEGAEARYWGRELRLRRAESRLGILAVGTGACLAIRRRLFQPIPLACGEDVVLPTAVAQQGSRVVQVETARATDHTRVETASMLKTRARMAQRNLRAISSRPDMLNPFRRPGYALSLWSHKLLRWSLPVLLLAALGVAVAGWVTTGGPLFEGTLLAFAVGAGAALVGFVGERAGLRIPGATWAYAFAVANLAFLIGLTRWLLGQRITTYR